MHLFPLRGLITEYAVLIQEYRPAVGPETIMKMRTSTRATGTRLRSHLQVHGIKMMHVRTIEVDVNPYVYDNGILLLGAALHSSSHNQELCRMQPYE